MSALRGDALSNLGSNEMDLRNLSVLGFAEQNMQYLGARQKVISSNIANATTPNFLAKDLEKPDFANTKPALEMNMTNPKHINPSRNYGALKVYTPQPTQALTLDGNGVVLEDQMNEASKTSSEYKRMITIYNKYKSMIQLANTKINA